MNKHQVIFTPKPMHDLSQCLECKTKKGLKQFLTEDFRMVAPKIFSLCESCFKKNLHKFKN